MEVSLRVAKSPSAGFIAIMLGCCGPPCKKCNFGGKGGGVVENPLISTRKLKSKDLLPNSSQAWVVPISALAYWPNQKGTLWRPAFFTISCPFTKWKHRFLLKKNVPTVSMTPRKRGHNP